MMQDQRMKSLLLRIAALEPSSITNPSLTIVFYEFSNPLLTLLMTRLETNSFYFLLFMSIDFNLLIKPHHKFF